ncbi:alpha-amylase family protein [Microlunatus soli]|uniref:Alpha-galactosidase n=1 Tax=Microlunatus soli TaxID=630515 RepID=A0A1H1TF09_9ACTN|nr:hypothetical protein [Microlunatus soli]SDS58867.1 alpha-galactosidase [Microlunatus soli]
MINELMINNAIVPTPQPDAVFVQDDIDDRLAAAVAAGNRWTLGRTVVDLGTTGNDHDPAGLTIGLRTSGEVSRIVLRWRRRSPATMTVSGDAWERSYGELGWERLRPERVLPWYWTGWDEPSGAVIGAGVDVRPSAFCFWTVDPQGISLWLDVRNGGSALVPGDREIALATVRWIDSVDRSPQQAQRDLVDAMAGRRSAGLLPQQPLVGANNWYYAYGVGFDREAVLGDARTVVELADRHPVRPYSVIDDGWNAGGPGSGGPWDEGIPGIFDDMAEVAAEITAIGARPGLWFRPLRSRAESDRGLAIPRPDRDREVTLDPTRPEVLDRVTDDLRRFRGWGYELIKHDFSSYDIFGRFGPAMGAELTVAGWSFADRSRTNAEIINTFYDVIREAADSALLLGCNTIGHLAAGVVDAQRTGDDTSGRDWERTRRMGVNTLAHRLVQHRRLFTVDADCVPCTPQVPWQLNRQFLDLVARSGTALFVSIDPRSRTEQTDADLAAALRIALDGGDAGDGCGPDSVQAIDGTYSSTPADWCFGELRRHYDWADAPGTSPFLG